MTDPRTLGPYQVLEQIGSGGMGVVYRAVDTRLGREVALKCLAAGFLPDDQAHKRFRLEARAASGLSHPNICTIYEIADHDGVACIAMELLRGQSLRDRIRAGALPIPELVDLAIPLADALDAAHTQGVIHRDLKPGNIFVTDRGAAKLLDFGLAKIVADAHPAGGPTADTRSASGPVTDSAALLGTLLYMSPEQVRGLPVDARSDLFSFGAVLYEMATGTPAFDGPTQGLVMESLLSKTPTEPVRLNREVPAALEAIIGKALEKNRELRYQSARDLLVDLKRLKGATSGQTAPAVPAPLPKSSRRRVAAGVLVALVLVTTGWWVWSQWRGPVAIEMGAIRQVTSLPGLEDQPTISPDGKMVAFVWQESGHKDLWVKQISGGTPVRLTNDPADDTQPDWSPDGSTIVFRSERLGGGLFTTPALGGDTTRLTADGFQPRWSPDGRRVVFQIHLATIPNEVHVVDYPAGQPAPLLRASADSYQGAEWSPEGGRLVSTAGAFTVGSGLFVSPATGPQGGFFLEWNGARLLPGAAVWAAKGRALVVESSTLQVIPIDANGRAAGPAARLSTSSDALGDIAADGTSMTYVGGRTTQTDIWRIALDPSSGMAVGKAERVTTSSAVDQMPRPLPGSPHLLFLSGRDGQSSLYVCDLDGQNVRLVDRSRPWSNIASVSGDGRTIVLWDRSDPKVPFQSFLLPFDPKTLQSAGQPRQIGSNVIGFNLSPDSRYLLYQQSGDATPGVIDAWEHPASDQPTTTRWTLSEAFREKFADISLPRFSADGRWIIFGARDKARRGFIFALRPGGTEPRLVAEGGWFPQWTSDPRRLHFWSPRMDGIQAEQLGFVDFDPVRGVATSGFRRVAFEPARGFNRTGRANLTPDGRWLFFEWTEPEGDIYVANLIVR